MNCKPGDLAYIVGNPVEELNGNMVEVLEFLGDFVRWGPSWRVTNSEMQRYGYASCPMPDSMLRPIAGPSLTHTVDVEIDNRQPVPA